MPVLIVIFLVLLMVLTGTFLAVLGVFGWFLLAVLGVAIVYIGVFVPVRNRLTKSDEVRMAEKRAELGYGAGPVETDEQRRRGELGYVETKKREI